MKLFFFSFDTNQPLREALLFSRSGERPEKSMSHKILGNTDTVSLEFSPENCLLERKRQSQEGNIEPEKPWLAAPSYSNM